MNSIHSNLISNDNEVSLSHSAIIAGIGILLMALTVPFAEFHIFPKLIGENSQVTLSNILRNKELFTTSIFLHLITLISDIVVAWALYIFLRPVSKSIALLTAWFRLVYTAIYLVSLANLVKVLNITESSGETASSLIADNVVFYINSFMLEWSFGLILFGIYLLMLGYLVYRAKYVPGIFGILLLLAGLGYITHTLGAFFAPETDLDFLFFTFFGELIFMIWLLVKGRKVNLVT